MSQKIKIAEAFIEECWKSEYNTQSLYEIMSSTCQHQKTIGTCYGINTFKADCNDWSYAFPDYGTTILKMHHYDNTVVCEVIRHGTHLRRYKSTNPLKNIALIPTDFFGVIERIDPTQKKYILPATLVFTFEQDKINKIVIEEVSSQMPAALGISHLVKETKASLPPLDYTRIADILFHVSNIPLSNRDIQCLALTLCGLSAKHIASFLGNSYRTVEKTLARAYHKLGVCSKQDMIEKMYQNYLLNILIEFGRSIMERI